jgi:MSHA biogenesis protein MshP
VKTQTTNYRLQTGSRKIESGFSLVTAIFLLVVLAGLGTVMVTFFSVQQQSSAKDVLGSRAYQAARTGIEWAAYGVSATTAGSLWAGCASGVTFAAGALGGTLAPFRVVVACTSSAFTEGTNTIYIYTIDSTATGVNGAAAGSTDYVEREIKVKMGR